MADVQPSTSKATEHNEEEADLQETPKTDGNGQEDAEAEAEEGQGEMAEPPKKRRKTTASNSSESGHQEEEENGGDEEGAEGADDEHQQAHLVDQQTIQEAIQSLEAAGQKVICVIQDIPVQYFDGKNWVLEKPKVGASGSAPAPPTPPPRSVPRRTSFRCRKASKPCGHPGHGIGLNSYKQCHVRDCRTYFRNYCGPKLTFFALPTDQMARDAWMSVVPWKDPDALPKFTFVCEAHFHPSVVFISPGQKAKRLLAGAVPSYFEPTPAHCPHLPSEVLELYPSVDQLVNMQPGEHGKDTHAETNDNQNNDQAQQQDKEREGGDSNENPDNEEADENDEEKDAESAMKRLKGHQECWVLGCEYRSKRYIGEKRPTFKLPQKDPEELQRWLSVLPLTDGQTISKRSSICSAHFDQAMIKKSHDGRFHLLPGALPYIFDPNPSLVAPSKQKSKPLPNSPATEFGIPCREYLVEKERLEIIEKINGQRPKELRRKKREPSVPPEGEDEDSSSYKKTRTVCSVKGCMTNTSQWIGPKRSVFRVPKDPETREKWLEKVQLKDRPGHGKNNLNICEAHFRKKDVVTHETRGDKRLVIGAYPTIFRKDPAKYLKDGQSMPVVQIIGKKPGSAARGTSKDKSKERSMTPGQETEDEADNTQEELAEASQTEMDAKEEEEDFKRQRTRNLQKTPCFVPGCEYNLAGYTGPKRVTFYMPRWDRELLRKWRGNMPVKPDKWTKWASICEGHFEPHFISVHEHVAYLQSDAVPTVFPLVDPEALKDLPTRTFEKPKKIRKPTKRICCYKPCDYNKPDYYGPRRGLFRLPKNAALLDKWLENIGREGKDWIRPSTTLCAAHFDPELITFRGNCFLLTKDAVPTLFPGISE